MKRELTREQKIEHLKSVLKAGDKFKTPSGYTYKFVDEDFNLDTEWDIVDQDATAKENGIVWPDEKPELVKGGWYYFKKCGTVWIAKFDYLEGDKFYYTEMYDDISSNRNDWCLNEPLVDPATDEQVKHFLSLEAERRGIREGVTVKRDWCTFSPMGVTVTKMLNSVYSYADGIFYLNDIEIYHYGQWADEVQYIVFVRGNKKTGLLSFKTKRVNPLFLGYVHPVLPTGLINVSEQWNKIIELTAQGADKEYEKI